MILAISKTELFEADFSAVGKWYLEREDETLVRSYQRAVDFTLQLLAKQPELGPRCRFKHTQLRGYRFLQIHRPFGNLLLFYRIEPEKLVAARLIHGKRNLKKRLLEPPNSETD